MIVQTVHLTDATQDEMPFVSTEGQTARMKVSRNSVGRFLASAVHDPAFVRKTVSLSGQPAAVRSVTSGAAPGAQKLHLEADSAQSLRETSSL